MLSLIAGLLFSSLASAADVPMVLPHQGRLVDGAGDPLNGTHDLTVSLFDVASGGSAVWTETYSDLVFRQGYYAVQLGLDSANPLDLEHVDSDALYVSVMVDDASELGARQRVVSTPYALRADTSTHVRGGVVDASEIRVNGTTVMDSSGLLTAVQNDNAVCDSGTTGSMRLLNRRLQFCNGSDWMIVQLTESGAILGLSPSNASGMDLEDGVSPGAYVTFTLTNDGTATSDTLVTSLSNDAQFELGVDLCDGNALAVGDSCTVQVRPRAESDGALSGTLTMLANNNPTSVLSGTATGFAQVTGQVAFTSPGTHTWTVPPGVTSVSVVAVGGGGAGSTSTYYQKGGGGGGLGWINDYPVVPGNTYTVVVGEGGTAGSDGGDSYFVNDDTVAGFGGTGGNGPTTSSGEWAGFTVKAGGGYSGDGGGYGGGGGAYGGPNGYNSGGGAGGYTGNGGNGGSGTVGTQHTSGQGGGGGGGGLQGGNRNSGGGGGVGLLGQGPSGNNGLMTADCGGFGGSGGAPGTPGDGNYAGKAGAGGGYGGGGAGSYAAGNSNQWGPGASGAVRIIWPGDERAFPSVRTGDE